MEKVAQKIREHDQKIAKLEQFEVKVSEQYKHIEGKLDGIEVKLDRAREEYVSKDICTIICERHKDDIDNIGKIARDNTNDLKIHIRNDGRRIEKYASLITGGLLITYVVAKLAKVF